MNTKKLTHVILPDDGQTLYLTPGKKYKVEELITDDFFVIKDDDGEAIPCSLYRSSHVYNWCVTERYGDWIPVYEDEPQNSLS